MTHDVVFAPEARDDLLHLYNYIAKDSGAERAKNYTDRIITFYLDLATFPERATRRDDLRLGLCITTFRRRVTIAFHITASTITIDRILYGGRNLTQHFDDEGD